MKLWLAILGALATFALTSCDSDAPIAKPEKLSISVSHDERLGFDQFITSMGILAQKTQVVFSHPSLPSPLFIASGELAQRWTGGGCPVTLQVKKIGLHLEGAEITHSELAAQLTKFVELTRGTQTMAVIVVLSANDVPFADGIEALRTLLRSGIDHIIVPAPRKPSDPFQQRPSRKPTPPSSQSSR